MNASPPRFLSAYGRTLTQRGDWMRRVAIVGSGHPKSAVLASDMAGLAGDLLGLPVIEMDTITAYTKGPAAPSVLLCVVDDPIGLAAAAGLVSEGHRVVVTVPASTLPDIFDLVASTHPHQPHRGEALLSVIGFAACLSDAGDESGMSIITHMAPDRAFSGSLKGVPPEGRTASVLNALELDFRDGHDRYGRHGEVLPLIDGAEMENVTITGGLGPLSDSPPAPTIETPEE